MDTNDTYQQSELIELLKQKNIRAYHYFYDKYAAALYGFILRIIKNEETANDVLHEIFTTLWLKINSYHSDKERLFSWLLKITRNEAINQRETNYQEQILNQPSINKAEILRPELNLSEFNYGSSTNPLPELKEENRALIDLCFYQGFTREQIAETLNIPLGSVSTRIKNALLDLRKSMDKSEY